MKRDLDIIRGLMLCFEAMPPGQPVDQISNCDDQDPVVVMEHIALLIEQGLLEGYSRPIPGHPEGGMFKVIRITSAGHDFLDSVRDPSVWDKTKGLLKKMGSWTFGVVVDLSKEIAKRQLGELLS